MAFELLSEGVVSWIIRLLYGAVRILLFLIIDLAFYELCWWVGFVICRIVTLGHYPESKDVNDSQLNPIFVSTIGLISLLLLAFGLGAMLA